MRALSLAALVVFGLAAPRAPEPMRLIRSIELPVEGRMDHMTVDDNGEKLFVAALANNTVEVVDLKSGVHLKTLTRFREPTGTLSPSSSSRRALGFL
jgi:hypothetical protein